ncbi:hypothetical protein LK542_06110 [Massilia sp. IC2-477]|uniref:hypothetical protein n=1 Tax=Massilia sp. IC2-477 TaxID=2887198 RepID=UPI001D0FB8A6|nr:hypothetical protein [Massilia sp. IC2-477]MCC2955192.1 hypothetical protein [Massilia sp. IC2-477]
MATSNTVNKNEIPVDSTDPTKTAWGSLLATQYFFVLVNGTGADETFDAADISTATQTRMAAYGRGISVVMGGGNDTVIGSGFGDTINAGAGTNFIDGGANAGATPDGSKARDVLNVFAADAAAAAALQVIELTAAATGADGEAYAAGYRIKVSNGAETDYLKNVEQINVFRADDNNAYVRTILLAVDVREIASADVAGAMHFAWAQGTDRADSFDAQADVTSATRDLMATHGRGVYVDMGAGNDTVVGSGFGDDITLGSGTNYADGGANAGTTPWGGKPQDVLHVIVANAGAAAAVQVVQLGTGLTGVDAQAFANGYTHKVVAGSEIDYIKGIERVTVQVADGSGGSTWARDIALETVVHEADLGDPNLADYMHLAWVSGTANDDSINAADLLSNGVKAKMAEGQQGVWIDGGSGNDTITGTAYGDNIRNGSGNAKIDGGANAGGMDVFEISVDSTAAMNAVQVTASDDPAYTWMVSYGAGTQKDYLKNIEAIVVSVASGGAGKWIPLAVQLHEISADGDPATSMHHAWAQGTDRDDSFDAAAVSNATKALMGTHGRGVYADMGAGNDTVVGSGYGDDITLGSGTNYADGGANAGTTPWGGKPQDVLHVIVANAGAAAAVQVIQLDSGASGVDAQAFANGYTHKVVAGNEIDYIKGIERVSVQVATGNGGSTWARDIPLETAVHEADLSGSLSNYMHLAWVNGTAGGDIINATDLLSNGAKAKMAELQKGVWIDGGSGNDTITGTAYGDNIRNGSGNAKIDGGANAGGKDVFEISVDSIAAMDAVQVVASDDPAYSLMVTYGNGQKDYLKNIEAIAINVSGSSAGKWIPLVVETSEISAGANLANASHFAWAQGTGGADSFDAASVSNATKALMAQHGRGVYANMGAGDDSVTGSGYGDHVILGSGTNYFDGGANAGSTTWGGQPADVLQVSVASQAAANAVQVTSLTAGMGGADAQAFADGYTHKVVAGSEIDYLKNVERVSIVLNGSTWVRDVALAVQVQEAAATDPNIGGYQHLAWVTGTAGADSIDLGGLLSTAVTQQMATRGKGAWIDGGAGNDTIVASAWGDNIVGGGGVNYIDGGANLGATASGSAARDVLEMFVASQAEADAIAVTVLSAASTGADLAAFNAGYKFRVANATAEVNYLKNVEHVNVMLWNDKDGDGQRDGLPASDPANELTLARGIALEANTAPSFAGAPAGVAIEGVGAHYIQTGATVLANGKLLSMRQLVQGDGSPSQTILARHNADGSVDTSFGGGTGRVVLPTSGVVSNVAPVELAGGKVMLAISTPGSNFDFRVMRVNADGSLDASFGDGGSTTVNIHSGSDLPTEILVQPDGKVVVAGWGNASVAPFFMVATRLNTDGSLDTSFGTGGKLQYGFANVASTMASMALQGDKLLVSGYVGGADGTLDAAVLRFNSNGSLDTSFGDNGVFLRAIGIGTDNARSMVVLPDGKILLGGTMRSPANDVDGFLLRLNANGSIDTGFGSGGVVKAHLTDGHDVFAHIAVQPDGKIIAYGTVGATQSSAGVGGELMVMRYLANGQLDTSFGTNGTTRVPGHGIGVGADPGSLVLVDGKIVIFGTTMTNAGSNAYQPLIARLNGDGSLDTSFYPSPLPSIGGSVQANGILPVALDTNGAIYDAELHARGNYGGASLKLARQGGASGDDQFWAVGDLSFAGGILSVGGTAIGTVTQNGGTLTLSFNTAATQGLVNRALHGIAYSNGNANPPASVSIDWSFSDGNSGSQGFGGALSATATSQVLIGTTVREIARSLSTPDNSTDGAALSSYPFLAYISGSARSESFDSGTQLSASVRTLMAELGRGARFNLGAGDDTLIATAFSDDIFAGSGINRIDGGDHAGTDPFSSSPGRDTLHVVVADQAAANAVSVTRLTAGMSGADADAFAAGYEVKVVAGSEIDYVKNVEMIKIFRWTDTNGNNTQEGSELTWVREIPVALRVYESAVSPTDPTKATDGRALKDIWHLATAEGWERNDSFDALTNVSSATQQLMAQQGRGIWVDGGAGDDTLAGSAYGDNFIGGSGTNYIDGRANGGSTPNGQRPEDVLEIYVDSQARANAVQATVLDAASTGADAQAFANGYTWKVVDGAAVNYVKNVEAVNIFIWTDTDGDHMRDAGEAPHARHIRLSASVNEIGRHPTDPTKDAAGNPLSGAMHMAWVNGSAGADSFTAATDISSATRGLMDQYQRGVFVETHAGNDTVTGSAYGDNFITGAGINRIDGGDNRGTHPAGGGAFDMLEIYVASQAEAEAVAITALTSSMTGADAAAWNDGYRYKVVNGAVSTDYIKNIEQLNVMVWTDKDGDGQRDWGSSDTDPAREISYTRSVGLVSNTAPSFAGAPQGAMVRDGGADYGYVGGVVLGDGKLMALGYLADANNNYRLVFERSNADGSIDTSFGNGSGRVFLDTAYGPAIQPVLLASGKLLVAHQTVPGNVVEVLRVNQDGSIDTSFGTNGATLMNFGSTRAAAYQVIEAGDKLWVVGYAGSTLQTVVGRLNADGSLDTSFSGDGMLTLTVGTGNAEVPRAAAVQPDGKLVIVGYAQGSFNQDAVALRLNPDGSYDTSFGTGGKVFLRAAVGVDAVDTGTSMALLPNGKILVGGYVNSTATSPGSTYDGMLMRLNANGSLDTGFGTNGVVRVPGTPNQDYVFRVVAQDDGSVLTLGITGGVTSTNGDVTITRFRPDGSLDAAFGNGGQVRFLGRGMGSDYASLVVKDGKILVFGAVNDTTQGMASALVLRLNADGSFDTSFGAGHSSLGGVTRLDGNNWTALDTTAAIYDAELAARGNYGGATLTIERSGGANADDLYAGVGEVSFANGQLAVAGTVVGTVGQQGGRLSIVFNNSATQELVNRALHGIGYANDNPAATGATLNWQFSDGNAGGQGLGGVLGASGTTTVEIGLVTWQALPSAANPAVTTLNQPIAQLAYLANVDGSGAAETFDGASAFLPQTAALMATQQRGAFFEMGGGGDTVTGTAYSDEFVMGTGVNRIDGGANAGNHPQGGAGKDQLLVWVANEAEAAAVKMVKLVAGMSGDDATAFTAGYEAKVVNGAEIDYIKNIERVVVSKWNDADGDRIRDVSETAYQRDIALQPRVFTIAPNQAPLPGSYHFAWIDSWARNDSVNVATDVPEATRALMDQYQRGVFIDTGAGDDTIVGSAYGDNITAGPGANRVDGGANLGTHPQGGKTEDILDVYVRTSQEAGAVVATALTSAMTGDDGAAYTAGYRWKLVSAQETDYLKNIEAVNITVWNDANGNGVRDSGETAYARQIALESRIDEVRVNPANAAQDIDGRPLADSYHFAWARGTAGDDVIDAASISQPTRNLMDQYDRGMWGQLGDGNDRVTGSAYGDNIDLGKGVNRFDGGADIGTGPNGSPNFDVLEIHVRSQAEADAVAVVKLTSAMTGEDGAAFGQGYQYKVNGPDQVNYIRNVEQVYVGIWNDADGDGNIDHGAEVTPARLIDVEQNSAPRFAPPQGFSVVDYGWDFTPADMEFGPDGKLYFMGSYDPEANDDYYIPFLARHNADGTVDTSFGNGAGFVPLAADPNGGFGLTMKVLPDGKLIVVTGTQGQGSMGLKAMRYHADGSLDTSFGTGGASVVGFTSMFVPNTVLVGPDGALIIAGNTGLAGSSQDFGVVRMNANGSLDTGFNDSGKLVITLSPYADSVLGAQLQADGKLVLAGATRSGSSSSTNDFAVVRVNANGSLDTSFGNGGKVVVPLTTSGDIVTAVNLLPGGAILLTGHSNNGNADANGIPHVALVKLDASGNLASGFGNNGKVFAPDTIPDSARATVIQPDGKIVVVGQSGHDQQLAVTRYNADGSLDTGFAEGGRFHMPIRGMRDYATAVALDGDKIVLMIPSFFNTNADSSLMLARLNADGSLDTSFAPGQFDTLGGTLKANGTIPTVLDHNAMIYDAELAERGNYGGASLTVERQGGRNTDDVFSLVDEVSASGGQLSVGGVVIGTVLVEPGKLRMEFNESATQGLVNRALHGIAYANKAANPSSSVTIGWRFEDGNQHNEQGGGGIGVVNGHTTVQFAAVASEVQRSWQDPALSSDNRPLSGIDFFASVTGSRTADDVGTGDLSSRVKALMAEFSRGATYQMLGGGDKVLGTGFSDEFIMGDGVNHVDGGPHAGSSPYGSGPGEDTLIVYVPNQAAADAVTANMLTPLSTGADADAYAAGYEAKIVSGSQVDYIRNVEQVSVHLWTDTNGNGIVDGVEGTYLHNIQFRTHVSGRQVSAPGAPTDVNGQVLADQWHFAWASGFKGDDWVIVEHRLSSSELQLMNQYGRGAWVSLGDGNDVVAATIYGDNINVGKGLNWVDGGTNLGTTPDGFPAGDVLEINVATLAQRNAVTYQVLTAGMSGEDAHAYAEGFKFKVVAQDQIDYLVNVEQLALNVWNDANGNGQREASEITDQVWVTLDPNAQGIVVVGTPQG